MKSVKRFGLFSAVIFCAAVACFGLALLSNLHAPSLSERLNTTLRYLSQNAKPVGELNLSSITQGIKSSELKQGDFAVPDLSLLSHSDLKLMQLADQNCELADPARAKSAWVKKSLIWLNHTCGVKPASLPLHFFDRPPFYFLNGQTYAELLQSERPEKSLLEQVNRLLPFKEDSLLSFQLKKLQSGIPFLLLKKHVLILNSSKEDSTNYKIIRLEDFVQGLNDSFLKLKYPEQPLQCVPDGSTACFQEAGPLGTRWAILGFLLLLFLFFSALFNLNQKQSSLRTQRKQQEEERLFLLRILSHELRTPIASLSLWLEILETQVKQIPPHLHQAIFSLREQINRMRTLAEKTSIFSQALDKSTQLKLVPESVDLREMCLNGVARAGLNPSTVICEGSCLVKSDTFWLETILQNLIQNAIDHGKPPLTLKIVQTDRLTQLTLTDQGSITLSATEAGMIPTKSASSNGLGLGIKLVCRLCELLLISIKFSADPTQVLLEWKKKNE